ncbi:MAG: MBL fold metallo-hydrolase [candidate division WOR-3 bacterium]
MKTAKSETPETNFIVFLGTGGARIVVAKQLRATGGMWFSLNHTNFIVDPGPGSLVKVTSSKHHLDPTKLDAIILSHKHIDHSNDVNIMIEAMTTGGTVKRGKLFCPKDALEGDDKIILNYLRDFLDEITILREHGKYKINGINFTTPKQQHHPGDVYGLIFDTGKIKISYVVDTKYFPELADIYRAEIMIFNVIRLQPSEIEHLSLDDVKTIIQKAKPKTAILTHFGMTMLKAKPWKLADELTQQTGIKVIAANDGMKYELSEVSVL